MMASPRAVAEWKDKDRFEIERGRISGLGRNECQCQGREVVKDGRMVVTPRTLDPGFESQLCLSLAE